MKNEQDKSGGNAVFPRWIGWLLLAVLFGGCGGSTSGPPAESAAGLTARGWEAFEAGDYATAAERFAAALDLDAGFLEAMTGQGWADLRRGNLSGAGDRFDAALDRDPSLYDAAAGRMLVEAGSGDPTGVIRDGSAILEAVPGYVFTHDRDLSASDLHWFLARAALDLGDDARVLAELDVLAPGHGLDPEAADFADRVLALLETLAATV